MRKIHEKSLKVLKKNGGHDNFEKNVLKPKKPKIFLKITLVVTK